MIKAIDRDTRLRRLMQMKRMMGEQLSEMSRSRGDSDPSVARLRAAHDEVRRKLARLSTAPVRALAVPAR